MVLFNTCNLAEPWWVNSLIRNPVILPYTHGIKRLDKIYLDTTFASKRNHCRRFPTKADGLKELLEKVYRYPIDTVFHFHAWTFGYEEVWIALSSALRSQVVLYIDSSTSMNAYARLDSRRRIQVFFVQIFRCYCQKKDPLPRRICPIWLRVWQQVSRRLLDDQPECSPAQLPTRHGLQCIGSIQHCLHPTCCFTLN